MIGKLIINWIDSIRNEISFIKGTSVELRKYGITIGGILIFIVLIAWWKELWNTEVLLAISLSGIIFMLVGLEKPQFLKTFHYYWMCAGIIIGSSISQILLLVIYYFLISPIAIFARLFGKKFLLTPTKRKTDSYWIIRDQQKKSNYERMS